MSSVENEHIIEPGDIYPFISRNVNIHSVSSLYSILVKLFGILYRVYVARRTARWYATMTSSLGK
jgi:hypothetical protein